MFAGEIGEFLCAIEQNRPAEVTPEQTRDVLKIVLATKKSLEEAWRSRHKRKKEYFYGK